jgi:homoserine dehydrogenase
MKETGRAFDDVLAEAQAKGYAETPPDLDVDGIDTAHKLSLVSAVSNGSLVRPQTCKLFACDLNDMLAACFRRRLLRRYPRC